MMMACCTAWVREGSPGAIARSYLDDVVAYGKNWKAGAVGVAWNATRRFGESFGLVLNVTQ